MPRPQIIRADTLDLQDQDSPSAKDHTRQPEHPAPLGDGPPAPHQAVALKNAGQEVVGQNLRSPRHSQDLSSKELELLHADGETYENGNGETTSQELLNGASTGAAGEDGELSEADGDDGLDDDMMDKISSSPSIEDGGYPQPKTWHAREAFPSTPMLASHSLQSSHTRTFHTSTNPLSMLVPANASHLKKEPDWPSSEDHHQGGYPEDYLAASRQSLDSEDDQDNNSGHVLDAHLSSRFSEDLEGLQDSINVDSDTNSLERLLLPTDDPLLDNSFDDISLFPSTMRKYLPETGFSWDKQTSEDNDDTEDVSFSDDTRFIDSGWGGECLRDTEDIDFEFVYALHTFVATVEGQANATKGDTMVLLDDSNSYWWLVRVVKDSSIGYLPAEHIETPTERLARLNKHRNIDLSQTMLGDNPEKSKNPLKKAMRRRNAKTVTFSAPTYVEASDVEYSSDEEDGEDEIAPETEGAEEQEQATEISQDQSATVEPLHVKKDGFASDEINENTNEDTSQSNVPALADGSRTSDEIFENLDDGTSNRSRKGTVRNTDSFYKDDTMETRKLSLTPSLLRDDSSASIPIFRDSKESKTRGSLEDLEKVASPTSKDEKKRKDKKPGMLSGLFKRKDRRSRVPDEDFDDSTTLTEEPSVRPSPQPKDSSESLSQETQSGKSSPQAQPARQSSKLQKSPPTKFSPNKPMSLREEPSVQRSNSSEKPAVSLQPGQNTILTVNTSTPPRGMDFEQDRNGISPLSGVQPLDRAHEIVSPLDPQEPQEPKTRDRVFSPIRDALRSSPSPSEPKPQKAKKAKQRVAMDDFDSPIEAEEPPNSAFQEAGMDGPLTREESHEERLSESPVQVSLQDVSPSMNPPALVGDTSSQEEQHYSPVSPTSTPELVDTLQESRARDSNTPVSTTQSSTNTPTWSDASLRSYLEDDTDIRDMLVVVHDKSNVKPAGPNHPIVGNLFKEENRRLGEISNRLDGLLTDWMARKAKAKV